MKVLTPASSAASRRWRLPPTLMAMIRSGRSVITMGPEMPPAWMTWLIRSSASNSRRRGQIIFDVSDARIHRRRRIEADDLLAPRQQTRDDGAAEKPARARDQNAV